MMMKATVTVKTVIWSSVTIKAVTMKTETETVKVYQEHDFGTLS